MSVSARHFWIFVAAVVAANAISILITALVFKASPGLREHHPGF